MTVSESMPRVLIFDDFHDDLYRGLAQEGAEQAGWTPLVFDSPSEALQEFDVSINALVTALGTGTNTHFFHRFPAMSLIEKSTKLAIPRALMSAHPDATDFIRVNSPDIVLPKIEATEIPRKLSAWLLSLATS